MEGITYYLASQRGLDSLPWYLVSSRLSRLTNKIFALYTQLVFVFAETFVLLTGLLGWRTVPNHCTLPCHALQRVEALVRWATGKRLTSFLPKLSLITLPLWNGGMFRSGI